MLINDEEIMIAEIHFIGGKLVELNMNLIKDYFEHYWKLNGALFKNYSLLSFIRQLAILI